ncbi:MAG: hypothetical protein CMG26_02050 [Candidatus Marinimicrobia bacterium]|nr:hypothetical protein [Candidatus Neomarinimicrobiota bacterium]
MRIGLFINKRKEKLSLVMDILFKYFSKDEIVFLNELEFISTQYEMSIDELNQHKNLHYDILIAVGGDGTTMSAIRSQYECNKPFLSIHIGNLGFLAESDLNQATSSIENLKNKNFITQNRAVFKVSVNKTDYTAINDVVIDRGQSGRMISLDVEDRGMKVNTYEGDGLIISTANGSTGYSLSAGGPIISPDLHLFTLTPICSHSLMTRTIVLSEESKLSIRTPSDQDKVKLTIDGQTMLELKQNSKIDIMIDSKKVPFILFDESNYYSKLKTKMGWYNSRNK